MFLFSTGLLIYFSYGLWNSTERQRGNQEVTLYNMGAGDSMASGLNESVVTRNTIVGEWVHYNQEQRSQKIRDYFEYFMSEDFVSWFTAEQQN